jgi:hypothetical protein
MKGARRLLPLLAVVTLAVVGGITVFLREPVRKAIVIPISYAIWYVNQIFDSVPCRSSAVDDHGFAYLIGRMFLKAMPVRDLSQGSAAQPHSTSRHSSGCGTCARFLQPVSQELGAQPQPVDRGHPCLPENLEVDDVHLHQPGPVDLPPTSANSCATSPDAHLQGAWLNAWSNFFTPRSCSTLLTRPLPWARQRPN